MLTITTPSKSPKNLSDYYQLVLTEDSPHWHRLVETGTGALEYRLGAGKFAEITPRTFRTLIRTIVQAAKSHQIEYLRTTLSRDQFPGLHEYDEKWFYSTITENALLAAYEYTRYKTKKDTKKEFVALHLESATSKEAIAGVSRGVTIATFANKARDIANTPGCDMTPSDLAKAAKELFAKSKVKVTVLGEKEIKKLKMGALYAVGKGTKSETRFIIAEYWGAGKPSGKNPKPEQKPIVFIGKGVTFDSGGLNVKPSGAMHDMHLDMSGGSAVLGSLAAVAALGLKRNIIGLVPAAENAISDDSMRAGDIVTSMSGQTIEVIHTDAEGRMILADALTYSERYQPQVIIDVATLTGAAIVALGEHASALMTKNQHLSSTLTTLAEQSGDYLWPLPLWDEYKQHIKSSRADIANIAPSFSKWGGAIEGGIFLSHFAPKDVPWAHLDIAPRMDSIPSDKLAKGSTGEPVRLLVTFLENWQQQA